MVAVAIACAGTLVLGACGGEDKYGPRREEGYIYTVIFDANGGQLQSNSNSQIKYLLHENDVAKGCKIYEPDDRDVFRGEDSVTCSNTGYFLAGWYRGKTDRVNENDEPVDDYGFVCKAVPVTEKDDNGVEKPVLDENGDQVTELLSENGRGPGYVYSDPWDFSKKITPSDFDTDSDGDGKNDTILLYAGWVPEYQYRVHWKTEGGRSGVSTLSFNPDADSAKREIPVPSWGEEGAKQSEMAYGDFPKVDDATFTALYTDEARTQKVDVMTHPGEMLDGTDAEDEAFRKTGACFHGIVDYYADYKEGEWFRIYTAADLARNLRLGGCYEILDDLDFNEITWKYLASFKGKFIGNNHSIKNITFSQGDSSAALGGLFGAIEDEAVFQNISFENVSYTFEKGSRMGTGMFGLFAGTVGEETTLENVKVSGTFSIGFDEKTSQGFFVAQDEYHYHVGLLSGNGVAEEKIDFSGITLKGVGRVTPTADEHGVVTITVQKATEAETQPKQ